MKRKFNKIEDIKSSLIDLYGGNDFEYQFTRYSKLFELFKKEFLSSEAYFVSSPGRVEVCGNHTDHNGGKVVACAINLDSIGAFLPTDNSFIRVLSQGYPLIEIDLNNLSFEKGTSKALIVGIIECLKIKGYKIGGFNACITSNVLNGAGISSSASFELLITEIYNFLYNEGRISAREKAEISQYAEVEFFGKKCGLLDQSAISFGGVNLFDFFDKNKLTAKKIQQNLKELSFILIDTGSSHADLSDEYSSIPNDMFSVAKFFGKERLCEISEQEFIKNKNQLKKGFSQNVIDRVEHFYEENKRVELACLSMENGDYNLFFESLNNSGISSFYKLRNCFVEGDAIMAIPKTLEFCKSIIENGAYRIHGGGFAGCVLVAINENKYSFIDKCKEKYGAENILEVSVREKGVFVL